MINVISSVRFNPDEIYPGISESAQPAIIAPNIGIIPNATNVLTFFFNNKYVIKTIKKIYDKVYFYKFNNMMVNLIDNNEKVKKILDKDNL